MIKVFSLRRVAKIYSFLSALKKEKQPRSIVETSLLCIASYFLLRIERVVAHRLSARRFEVNGNAPVLTMARGSLLPPRPHAIVAVYKAVTA